MWWRFRRHKLAMVGTVIVLLFYMVVLFAPFLAYADPSASEAQRSLLPPQRIHWFVDGHWAPHVYGLVGKRDPTTFKRVYTPDPALKIPVRLFAQGFEYRLFGLVPATRHLVGVEGARPEDTLFLLGTDEQGRDLWSRLMYGTQTSLTIGLVGVAFSLVLGVMLGGVSGLYGGAIDSVIQRVIEIVRSIPTIPLWMGLAAALPNDWTVMQVYFAITIIISLVGWTELARSRGRFLSLRGDFVTAAELSSSGQLSIIIHHLVPSFLSHIIAATTQHSCHDHQRDVAVLPGPGAATARHLVGRAAAASAEHPGARHLALAADLRGAVIVVIGLEPWAGCATPPIPRPLGR
jgi:peptide/nickel transport system permease protein